MSYQVLARKWRPRNFSEIAGQEHVLRALTNALDQGRLHQAYLFTGTRGVGKTTLARILAKALNCEKGVQSEPCGQCSACLEIDEGRFIDLIEVDAASRTKVEDTRELLDNVQYTPTRGRYKVYLIDEVHMLSAHSFNALLKTLEEPPPHVKFLLATTDPQKLPATILSRCLQFNLKRMSPEIIGRRLTEILDVEKLVYDKSSIKYLANAADGSMRDGLSLLDQALAYCENTLSGKDVANMLGLISQEPVYELLRALRQGDTGAIFEIVNNLEEHAADFLVVMDSVISVLQQLALAQWVPDLSDDDAETVKALAADFSAEDIQLLYQIALLGRRDMPLSPDMRRGFEMVLLRMMTFTPASNNIPFPDSSPTEKLSADNIDQPVSSMVEEKDNAAGESVDNWKNMYKAMSLKGMVAELAANVDISHWEGNVLYLLLAEQHAQLYNKVFEERLSQAVSECLKREVSIRVNIGSPKGETPAAELQRLQQEAQSEAVQAIEEDKTVQAFKDKFNAVIDADSIRPTN